MSYCPRCVALEAERDDALHGRELARHDTECEREHLRRAEAERDQARAERDRLFEALQRVRPKEAELIAALASVSLPQHTTDSRQGQKQETTASQSSVAEVNES